VAGGLWHWITPTGDPNAPPTVVAGPSELGADWDVPEFSAGATFGDVDGDGDLDLFVANYVAAFDARWEKGRDSVTASRDEPIQYQPLTFEGLPDRLYLNESTPEDGVRFREIPAAAGVDDGRARGLNATFLLVDGDIFPDLLVASDATPNLFFHNERAADGEPDATMRRRFVESAQRYGLSDRRSAMGLARGDADGDGDLDLLTTNYRNEATLFAFRLEARAGPSPDEVVQVPYFEVRRDPVLATSTSPWVGWGCVFFDYDDDGDEDIFIGNGSTSPREAAGQCQPERALLFRNRGDGVFDDVTASAGAALQVSYAARGVVCGDIDQDGDLDLVIAQNEGPLVVLENRRPAGGNPSITIVTSFGAKRADAVNAMVVVESGDRRMVHELLSGSSYLSQEPFEAHFGLGNSPQVDRVIVTWPWIGAPAPKITPPYKAQRIQVAPDVPRARIDGEPH